jgi:hypothetical protein
LCALLLPLCVCEFAETSPRFAGISGQSGRHDCTICIAPASERPNGEVHALVPFDRHKDAQGPSSYNVYPNRCSIFAASHHAAFLSQAGGRRAKAKEWYNQVNPTLIAGYWCYEIVPSPLHVTLGRTRDAFDQFEAEAALLDKEAKTRGVAGDDARAQVSGKPVGPFQREINALLKGLKIERQPQFGGSFNGNACHKILKNGRAFGAILGLTEFRRQNAPLVEIGSNELAEQYGVLFSKLRQCHVLYSAARWLCPHEQLALWLRCASVGNWYPHSFQAQSLPPKFHLLTRHMPEFAEKWRSIGLASEQAVESSNRIFNRLQTTHITNSDDVLQMKAMMQQLRLESNPAVRVVTPIARICPKCELPIAKRFAITCSCSKRRRGRAQTDE